MDRRRAFVVHVLALSGAGVAFLGAVALGWPWLAAPAGALLVVAGVAAYRGRRSLVLPRGARRQMDGAGDEARRAELEAAAGMMMGTLLVLLGAITTVVALYLTAA